jgi:CDP-diacylglycerol--glycerol-3-phosphate 3-phosphatidyltransferase
MVKHSKKHNDKKRSVAERAFNIPNSLTMLRIILAPIFMILLLNNKYIGAFIVILIASITDFLDGQIARRFNMQTAFGRMLDPIADKVLIFCAIVALLIKFNFPLWVGVIILARDLIILLGGFLFWRRDKQELLVPNIFGKVSTLFQLTTIVVFIVASIKGYYALWIDILIYLTVTMTLLSGIIYIFKGYDILSGRSEKK